MTWVCSHHFLPVHIETRSCQRDGHSSKRAEYHRNHQERAQTHHQQPDPGCEEVWIRRRMETPDEPRGQRNRVVTQSRVHRYHRKGTVELSKATKTRCWTQISRSVQPNLPARSCRNSWTWIWREGAHLQGWDETPQGTGGPKRVWGESGAGSSWSTRPHRQVCGRYNTRCGRRVDGVTIKNTITWGSVGSMLLTCLERSADRLQHSDAPVVSSNSLKLHICDNLCLSFKSCQPTSGFSSIVQFIIISSKIRLRTLPRGAPLSACL